jgi:hypothetical protein
MEVTHTTLALEVASLKKALTDSNKSTRDQCARVEALVYQLKEDMGDFQQIIVDDYATQLFHKQHLSAEHHQYLFGDSPRPAATE